MLLLLFFGVISIEKYATSIRSGQKEYGLSDINCTGYQIDGNNFTVMIGICRGERNQQIRI